ncbi:hypothetical protein [Frigoribacterium sp. UYMn621]|uniref:hypothetical protein n=1 Tax=Frigoribacterium sp. UYMn621 TaxID=3156343 RepID=UPI00339A20AE
MSLSPVNTIVNEEQLKKSLLGIVILAFVLVGCSSQALTLTPEESAISDCAPGHDPIPVATLNTQTQAPCKLTGVDLVFPDGTVLAIPEGSASGSTTKNSKGSQKRYTFYNVGVYGFVAGVGQAGCQGSHAWGSTEAKVKVREAFGKNWTCDG